MQYLDAVGVAECCVAESQERVAVGVLPDKCVVFEVDVGEVVVELAVCVAEEGARVLGSEFGLGPLAEGDSFVGAGCVWCLEYFPCELHALSPKWFYHWHWSRWSMRSTCVPQRRHLSDGSDVSRLRTKVARWTSFLHWRSSVSSESGVPKEAKTLGKGMCGPSLDFQAAMQLGSWSAVISWVCSFVMLCIVRSESLRGASLVPKGVWSSVCHPTFLG